MNVRFAHSEYCITDGVKLFSNLKVILSILQLNLLIRYFTDSYFGMFDIPES